MGRYLLAFFIAVVTVELRASESPTDQQVTAAIEVLLGPAHDQIGTAEHQQAWKQLASVGPAKIPALLRSLRGANAVAENWLTSAADTVADTALRRGEELPTEQLVELVRDRSAPARGRQVAYEMVRRTHPERATALLTHMLDDPNANLRYDAVARLLSQAEDLPKAQQEQKLELLHTILDAARDLEQLRACKSELKALGETVDLTTHMGFLTSWKMIGPFDNTGKRGFEKAYPPEKEIDFTQTYAGKAGPVSWLEQPVTTDVEFGNFDLTKTFGPVKGAVVYAYTEFESDRNREAFIRYASNNGTRLWVNGELVASNPVYHTGALVDQYIAPIRLKEGTNQILLKICQNEQTESWAQSWDFMLRVTDELGGAIHPVDRDKKD